MLVDVRTVMMRTVPSLDRLSGLDASLLAVEDDSTHPHASACLVFEGEAPELSVFIDQLAPKLERLPRFRRKLARAPSRFARPVWVDDPRFNLGYHVREAALPPPAGARELRELLARIAAQPLDRSKPLWELWLVERVGQDRFALILKRHLSLIDPDLRSDLVSVLLEPCGRAAGPAAGESAAGPGPASSTSGPSALPWIAEPEPSVATLLVEEVAGRLATPVALARAVSAGVLRPAHSVPELRGIAAGAGALMRAGLETRPPSPLNRPTGPHRRYASVEIETRRLTAIADVLGGTVHAVVLTVVGGALRAYYERHRWPTEDVELRASAPVPPDERPGVGEPPLAVPVVPLALDPADPVERWAVVREAVASPGDGAAPPTGHAPLAALQHAARWATVRPFGNLPVVDVTGPSAPLCLLGRRLVAIHPQIPLQRDGALSVGVMACAGTHTFGLLGDYDALPDLPLLAEDLEGAVGELAEAVAVDDRAAFPGGRLPSAAARRRQRMRR